jgi:hypothetical protein
MVKSMKENLDFTQKHKGFTFFCNNDLMIQEQEKIKF